MTRLFETLAERFARIPKVALFGVAALIQVALLAAMIIDRVQILREGTEVTLQTRPVDPRDLLRGDYVVLGYDISQLPAGSLLNQPAGTRNPIVFVKLAPNPDGFYQAVSVHTDAVAVTSPEVLIRGRVPSMVPPAVQAGSPSATSCRFAIILKTISSLKGEGRKLEQARNQRKLTVVAAVLPSGRAAIKRLLVDGEPIYEEPWF